MTNWATGEVCQWCGIAWSVVRVEFQVRAVGAKPRRLTLCKHDCLSRARALSACTGRAHALYEYVREVSA